MHRKGLAAALALALLAAPGCAGLNTWEQATYDRLVAQGAPTVEAKDPVLAGVLNILPGFGDAYNGQWGAFACNLLLWPASVLWGVPEAAITAGQQNRRDTVYFYLIGPGKGKYDVEPEGPRNAEPSPGRGSN